MTRENARKNQLDVKVGWYSETTMKDDLGFSAQRIKKVKEFCGKTPSLVRYGTWLCHVAESVVVHAPV